MTDRDPIYLIERYDPANGFAWFSCVREWTRRNVVEDIASGELDCVVKVLEIKAPEFPRRLTGQWTEITEGIAEEISAQLYAEHREPSYKVLTFLHANGLRQQQMVD